MDRATDGTFWIGTDNGLARWDGSGWLVYDNGNLPVLTGQILTVVQADTAGTAWFTQNWLHWFDGAQWITYDTSNSPLQEWQARRLYKAMDGKLVVGCSSGDLFFFDGSNWTVINPADAGLNSALVQSGQPSMITDLPASTGQVGRFLRIPWVWVPERIRMWR
jgi:ligand-binding sensor domain-containing protein